MNKFKRKFILSKLIILSVVLSIFLGACAKKEKDGAIKIGVTISNYEDKFVSYIRDGIQEYEQTLGEDTEVIYMDAKADQEKQEAQVKKLIEDGMDVVIVLPVDAEYTSGMTSMARKAKVPIVYGNNFPDEFKGEELPKGVYFVGSKEKNAGTIQMEYLAEKLGGKGNVAILMGDFAHAATFERTEGIEEVANKYPGIKIVDKETAKWLTPLAKSVVEQWMVEGKQIDAIASTNDEMAIGAIRALEEYGKLEDVMVLGVDATIDALNELAEGKLTATVFQDSRGQGRGLLDTAIKAARGENPASELWIPFQLVTPENYKEFLSLIDNK